MTEREYYRRFDNLSKKELNKKIIKKLMSEMLLWQLLLNVAGVKKKPHQRNRLFRKKIIIPDSEIPKCPEFEVKSKTGKIFKKHNPLEEYSVRIYEFDLYFYEHYEKKKIEMDVNTYYLELMFILMNFY